MIEIDRIKKHGKKILGVEEHGDHKLTFRERIPDILLEICIIVFAISLSIWLHNWQEHAASQKKAHHFLAGLRQDLQDDFKELRNDFFGLRSAPGRLPLLPHLNARNRAKRPHNKYRWTLYYSTNLYPKTARFDGLKFSGNLDIVEDEALQESIVRCYQELLPSLTRATQAFTDYKTANIRRFLDENLRAGDTNFLALLQSDQMRNYLSKDPDVLLILQRYHLMMRQNRQLISEVSHQMSGR